MRFQEYIISESINVNSVLLRDKVSELVKEFFGKNFSSINHLGYLDSEGLYHPGINIFIHKENKTLLISMVSITQDKIDIIVSAINRIVKYQNEISQPEIFRLIKYHDNSSIEETIENLHKVLIELMVYFKVKDFFDIDKETQEKIIKSDISLINKIPNLDPELEKIYSNTSKGSDAGFF